MLSTFSPSADTQTLAANLHFAPEAGHIQLFDQRMLLMHASAFAELRRDLVAQLGQAGARDLLMRLGWQQGFADGERVRRLMKADHPEAVAEALSMGPRLREIEGFVRHQPVEDMQLDAEAGTFWGDFFWHGSWEAQAHLTHCGVGGQPACWSMVGYADGYSTAVTGVPIHWREVECVAMGHACCRVVGRPLADWQAERDAQSANADASAERDELDDDLGSYLRVAHWVGAPPSAGRHGAAGSGHRSPPGDRQAGTGSTVRHSPAPAAAAAAAAAARTSAAAAAAKAATAASAVPAAAHATADPVQPHSAATSIPGLEDFVGASAGFKAVAHLVRKVAATDATVLFKGESGVGKERFARALHAVSPRADQAFVAINCAAIPSDLVEAELFGVERGAYTGADRSRPGRFERADGGTLFLDEVSSLSLAAQGKVLRALQEREFERVGGTELKRVDVRIVTAANVDLRDEVDAGRFRRDLFYRLNVFPIAIPPLRERLEDIPLLVALFLQRNAQRFGRTVRGLTPRAYGALCDYDWPGNVRELENMIERGVILAEDGGFVDVQHLFAGGERLRGQTWGINRQGALEQPASLDGTGAGATPPLAGAAPSPLPADLHAPSPGASAADGRSRGQPGAPSAGLPVAQSGAQSGARSPAPSRAQSLIDQLLTDLPSFDAIEQLLIDRAVQRCDGNVSAAARLLQVGRGQMDYRLRKRAGR